MITLNSLIIDTHRVFRKELLGKFIKISTVSNINFEGAICGVTDEILSIRLKGTEAIINIPISDRRNFFYNFGDSDYLRSIDVSVTNDTGFFKPDITNKILTMSNGDNKIRMICSKFSPSICTFIIINNIISYRPQGHNFIVISPKEFSPTGWNCIKIEEILTGKSTSIEDQIGGIL